jgi:hypothetical protein
MYHGWAFKTIGTMIFLIVNVVAMKIKEMRGNVSMNWHT